MFGKISIFVFAFLTLSCLSSLYDALESDCDLKKCPGPLYVYQEFGCEPVHTNDTCCPSSYRCDESKYSDESKCFVNGVFYDKDTRFPAGEIGDGCHMCICNGGTKQYTCGSASCAGAREGCYNAKSAIDCCPTEFCPESDSEVPICTVDGKTYKLGEYFVPSAEPEKICYCNFGYAGENVEPFCISHKPGWCANQINAIDAMRGLCAPVYLDGVSPQTQCNWGFVYFADDIEAARANSVPVQNIDESPASCKFGDITVRVGETHILSEPGKPSATCKCEVPPLLTCLRE